MLQRDDPWRVRIMPRVAFGVRPTSGSAADPSGDLQQQHQQDLQPDTPGVVVLHHFMASWQVSRHRKVLQVLTPLLAWSRWVVVLWWWGCLSLMVMAARCLGSGGIQEPPLITDVACSGYASRKQGGRA